MAESPALIIAKNFDGTVRKSWPCRFRGSSGTLLMFVGEFSEDVCHPDLGHIQRGTVSHEHYWLDRWYNVFRFHEPTGELRNYYCNVNLPPSFRDGVLEYVDLDLDLLVWPDFRYVVLDREEFESNAVTYGYSNEIIAGAEASLNDLIRFAELRNFEL